MEQSEKYFIRRQGRRLGPFVISQVERMIARRQLGPKDEISIAGSNQWQRADHWRRERELESAPSANDSASSQPVADSAEANSPSLSPASMGAKAGDWYVTIDEQQYGPIDESTLGQWMGQQRISAQTLVWREGMIGWEPVAKVLPAAVETSQPATQETVISSANGDDRYAIRDFGIRRAFWLLIVCIASYVFAAECLAAGIFFVYTAVAVNRFDGATMIALFAVFAFIWSPLLLLMAINMTQLRTLLGKRGVTEDVVGAAGYEYRIWMFAGLAAGFLLITQTVLGILFLIDIARAS